MRVGKIANRLQIVLKAIHHGDERDLDQFRFLFDCAVHVAQIDPSVMLLHGVIMLLQTRRMVVTA